MTLNNHEVIELASELAKEDGLKVTVKESAIGGLIAGACAMAGGVLGGPAGIAVGGTIGGCIAAVRAHNSFKSAGEVIMSLPSHRKQELADRVTDIIGNIDATDVARLLFMLSANVSLRQQIVNAIIAYIRNELQMQICD